MPTLSLGYLTAPVSIQVEVSAHHSHATQTVWSIVGFGQESPANLPTMAKYIIGSDPSANTAEKEVLELLHQALTVEANYAIIPISSQHVGLLLPIASTSLFSLQVAQIPTTRLTTAQVPTFDLDYLKHLPMQVMELAQTRQHQELGLVARGIYKMATVYGYWDLWLVLEGICARYQINPQELIQS